jgi:hypothetical protein
MARGEVLAAPRLSRIEDTRGDEPPNETPTKKRERMRAPVSEKVK